MEVESKAFWDHVFRTTDYGKIQPPDLNHWIYNRALRHFGDVRGKTIIDIGFGKASASLFFAYHGAIVISVDYSSVAVDNLKAYCQEHGINNISVHQMSAMDLAQLGKVDCVFGSMILHHLEPFSAFAEILRQTTRAEGRCFFWENNAQSSALMWCRDNLAGKLWIPKRGDPDEHPLMPREVDELRRRFTVRVEHPNFHFFREASGYLFRGKLARLLTRFDDFLFRYPWLRKYSYRQCLYLS